MATRLIGLSKNEEWRSCAAGAGGAVTDDVEVTITDTLTTEEAVIVLQKIIAYMVANAEP